MTLGAVIAPLFVPASRPDRFRKAAASGAGAVILDLEDAVAEADKDAARAALETGFAEVPVWVRVNARNTPWHEDDLDRLRGLRPDAVVLPKTDGAEDVAAVQDALGALPVVALIETARGLGAVRAIAASGVARLAFGSIDLSADLGCAHEREALLAARSEIVLASRLGGLPGPLDGVTAAVGDDAAAADDARHARMLGMTGKLCIHPRQVWPVAAALAPSSDEVDWARRVLAAGDGAVRVDGEMVDAPVRRRAEAIMAAARGA